MSTLPRHAYPQVCGAERERERERESERERERERECVWEGPRYAYLLRSML